MMFIVRGAGEPPEMPGIAVKLNRDTPPIVKDGAGKIDFFCLGETSTIAALRGAGWQVVELRDGYYEDGRGGGVAIWGQGKYWEIRIRPVHDRRSGRTSRGERSGGRPKRSTSRSAARSSAPDNRLRRADRRRSAYRDWAAGAVTGSQTGISIRSRSSCPLLILLNNRQPSPFCRISTTWKR